MAKQINEKTFELNITNELLNISKSFLWYMLDSPINSLMPEKDWFDLLLNSTFFSEGLTQEQETNPETGGYDVSIDYTTKNGNAKRLMFLQYKAGDHKNFCLNPQSKFNGSNKYKKPHISFSFNDAADNTQHSTLRSLANRPEINANSVLYVFPRITKKVDFLQKINNLISYTSFVPVLEIDKQAKNQNPPIIIDDKPHKFRTSYNGEDAEVNYYYYSYYYDNTILSKIISEIVCIYIERFLNIIKNYNKPSEIKIIIDKLINGKLKEDKFFIDIKINKDIILDYLKILTFSDFENYNMLIPKAPEIYTTEIPKDGLKFNIEIKNDTNFESIELENKKSNFTYQVF